MKRFDILKKANEVVAEHIARGYMINGNDSSCGYWYKVDMENEHGTEIRIAIKREFQSLLECDRLILKVEVLDRGWVDTTYEAEVREIFYEHKVPGIDGAMYTVEALRRKKDEKVF